jgi:hypothetical protein
MYGKAMISILLVAIFALSAAGTEEQQQQQRRVSRLRNRPGLFEVEGSHIPQRRPQGLLDVTSEQYITSSAATSSRLPQRQLKADKMAKVEGLATKAKEAKGDKVSRTKEAKKTRDESSTVQMSMSMSMDFRRLQMSMSMDFRQGDLSMSM